MANQRLRNTYYKVPDRHQKIIGSDTISYENLKKKKHIFDNLNLSDKVDKKKYEKMGGHKIRTWVDDTLRYERGKIKNSDKIKNNIGMDAKARKEDEFNITKGDRINTNNSLSNSRLKDDRINEQQELIAQEPKFKASLCIIENEHKQFLLLKRSEKDDYKPSHWCFAGGGIKEGESPIQAVKREVIEETLMDVYDYNLFKEKMFGDTLCYIFKAKTKEEEPLCNTEHDDYGWFKINEIKKLKTIEGVYEDIQESLKL